VALPPRFIVIRYLLGVDTNKSNHGVGSHSMSTFKLLLLLFVYWHCFQTEVINVDGTKVKLQVVEVNVYVYPI